MQFGSSLPPVHVLPSRILLADCIGLSMLLSYVASSLFFIVLFLLVEIPPKCGDSHTSRTLVSPQTLWLLSPSPPWDVFLVALDLCSLRLHTFALLTVNAAAATHARRLWPSGFARYAAYDGDMSWNSAAVSAMAGACPLASPPICASFFHTSVPVVAFCTQLLSGGR
jgi:hypothetical protein